ncbi:phospholipid carrier-dependent glycosyltransferase [Thermodesulfobacteriota bacterium]
MQYTPSTSKLTGALLRELVVVCVLCCLVSVPLFYDSGSARIESDETRWIHDSKFFKLLFIDRDFTSPLWQSYYSYDQPPVGKYIIGLALLCTGSKRLKHEAWELLQPWTWKKSYAWNMRNGALPSEALLLTARYAMVFFGILTCLTLYALGRLLFGTVAGFAAAVLFAFHPLSLRCIPRAMVDPPLLFAMTLAALLTALFYRAVLKQRRRQAFSLAAAIGITIGLGAGIKMNCGLSAVIFACFCLAVISAAVLRGWSRRRSSAAAGPTARPMIRAVAISLLICAVAAALAFELPNPFLWDKPVGGVVRLFQFRMETVKIQQEVLGPALVSLQDKTFIVFAGSFLSGLRHRYRHILHLLMIGLFAAGLLRLCWSEAAHLLRHKRPSYAMVILTWALGTLAGIIVWIPLPWHRYILPVVPCIALLSGYGLQQIILLLRACAPGGAQHTGPDRQHFFQPAQCMSADSPD